VRRTAALVTVNRSLEEILTRRYRPRRSLVLHNTPSRWTIPSPPQYVLRTELGLPPDAPIALFHGGFSAHRGLEELAAAVLQPGLERVHAVYMGYGNMRGWLDAEAFEPRYGGRLHVLSAVPPERLLEWVVDADVGVVPTQMSTLNHYLSSPNKLFECLAAGVPVVASDFPEMRRVVINDPDGPLGELCRPDDPADVARAIRGILALSPEARADLRRRCLKAAHERWNWETESRRLVSLYADLIPSREASPAAATSVAS
jgi:glycosyltransferase involved in cell wall biosynthesis